MGGRAKVLVIGLDSFDPDLARTWMDEGLLPNLAALSMSAARGAIRNPRGMEPTANWSSFAYGSGPGVHGLYDGSRYFDWRTYGFANHRPEDIAARPFWSRLPDTRSIAVDVPIMATPVPPGHVAIADWLTHQPVDGGSTLKPRSWPPELLGEVERAYGADPLDRQMCDFHQPRSADRIAWFRDALIRRARMKTALTLDLMEQEGWDFLITVYAEAHCAGHHFWQIHDNGHHAHSPRIAAKLGNPLRDVYVALDEAMGALRSRAGDGAIVMAYLSHGMARGYTGERLLDRILARLDGQGEPRGSTAVGVLRTAWRSLPNGLRGRMKRLRTAGYQTIYNRGFLRHPEARTCFEVHVSERTSGIRINLRGREPQGIVDPADYEAVCGRLIAEVGAVVNDGTGAALACEVVRTADHHAGPMLENLPDLLVTWNRDAPIRSVSSPAIGRLRHPHPAPRTGDHTADGLFLLAGPCIVPGMLDAPVDVTELAPTIAALMGADPSPFERPPIGALLPRGG